MLKHWFFFIFWKKVLQNTWKRCIIGLERDKLGHMFIGEYNFSIDGSHRVNIPNSFKKELEGTFVIAKGFEKCLYIFSISVSLSGIWIIFGTVSISLIWSLIGSVFFTVSFCFIWLTVHGSTERASNYGSSSHRRCFASAFFCVPMITRILSFGHTMA